MERRILEVSQINAYIKQMFDDDPALRRLCVRGARCNYEV